MIVEHKELAVWSLPLTMLALLLGGGGTAPDALTPRLRAIPAATILSRSTLTPDTHTPTPSAVPTATIPPTSTPAPSPTPQPVQTSGVSFVAADGVKLSGTMFVGEEENDIGVVLAHMGANGATQRSWTSFARHAAERGFSALTFNFRADRSKLDLDVRAAVGFLRDQGYQRIVCMGASMGGTACLKAAVDTDLAGLVVISSLWTTGSGSTDGALLVSRAETAPLTLPKLFVTTEKDGNGVPATMHAIYEAAPGPKTLKVFPGTAHGTDIFTTPRGDEFRALLVDFLEKLR